MNTSWTLETLESKFPKYVYKYIYIYKYSPLIPDGWLENPPIFDDIMFLHNSNGTNFVIFQSTMLDLCRFTWKNRTPNNFCVSGSHALKRIFARFHLDLGHRQADATWG